LIFCDGIKNSGNFGTFGGATHRHALQQDFFPGGFQPDKPASGGFGRASMQGPGESSSGLEGVTPLKGGSKPE